jgi:uncharacterized protein (DUF885 family)
MIDQFDGIRTAAAIDPATLDREDRITRHVLVFEAEGIVGSLRSHMAEFLVDPMLGLHMDMIQGIPQLRATDETQAWAFVEKASKVGNQFDQALERHRQGVANGRTPPRISVEKVMGQLDAFARTSVADNPFLQITLPDGWDDLQRARWRHAMEEQVTKVVNPALARYRGGIATDILPAARPAEHSGVCWLPDGEEVYSRAVRRYTSLDLTPAEIHQIGLDGIASLEDSTAASVARFSGRATLARSTSGCATIPHCASARRMRSIALPKEPWPVPARRSRNGSGGSPRRPASSSPSPTSARPIRPSPITFRRPTMDPVPGSTSSM